MSYREFQGVRIIILAVFLQAFGQYFDTESISSGLNIIMIVLELIFRPGQRSTWFAYFTSCSSPHAAMALHSGYGHEVLRQWQSTNCSALSAYSFIYPIFVT